MGRTGRSSDFGVAMSKKRLPRTGHSQSWPEAGRQTRAELPEVGAGGERAADGDVDFESIVAFDAAFKKG
jgi:hypothetical protein